MKNFFLLIALFLPLASALGQEKIHILLVTGGHGFEEKPFFEMFDSLSPGKLTYDHVIQPAANALYHQPQIKQYDAVVFYDMWQPISEQEKKAFLALLKKGKGMVFLHHSLVSYQLWPEFKAIIGGKYYDKEGDPTEQNIPRSTFHHGVQVDVQIIDNQHFITKDFKDFQLFDEVYGTTMVLPSVHPLLKTNHPLSTEVIGWAHQYGKSKIVYLQPGHGKETYGSPAYRTLLLNSILWVTQ